MTEAFFPGSRQRLGPPAGLPDVLGGLSGKTYTIAGKPVELFTISQVAEALNRKPVTVRAWERKGFIPRATFSKPGQGGDVRGRRRLYSKAQVEALVRIAREEGIWSDQHKQITRTNFAARALQAFKEIAGKP